MKLLFTAACALIAVAPLAAQTPAPAPANLGFATPLPGRWSFSAFPGGSEATFTDTSARPQLTLRCTRTTRRITMSKPASAAAPVLTVWTSSGTRNVAATFNPATAQISAEFAVMDPLLDAMALSRGRIGVTVPGTPSLVLPPWPEVTRVVEDCRA
jgi:hypothetical protein